MVGGGPVGLLFSYLLATVMGDQVRVRIHDRRWRRHGHRVVWLGRTEGNVRREQVVTVQSNVWSALPGPLQERLFVPGRYSQMWPLGPDSPADRGRPRNLSIRWIEDCLLDLIQDVDQIELAPGPYPPGRLDDPHVLVVSDGAASRTRTTLADRFGAPDPDPYSIDGVPLVESVLGIWVRATVPDEYTVPLTVTQNRFLFNSSGGGYINMRLTPEEVSEVVAIGENGPVDCIRRHGCTLLAGGGSFVCERHRSTLKPPIDRLSFLWPRVQDGVRFFGIDPRDILGISLFRLRMSHTARFVAQLAPATFGVLLGDAANALHFWPGRGLNTGIKGVLSLVRTLRSRWRGQPFRASDFAVHEGFMQQLQYREKSRAWTTMLMADENGRPRLIEDRLRAALTAPTDRSLLTAEMLARIRVTKARLSRRIGPLPDDPWYEDRLNGLHLKTLAAMVESGPWITYEVGGDEVSVDW